MNKHLILQGICALVFAVLAICLVNPLKFWMTDMVHMLILGAAVFVAGIFSVFVLSESALDERDIEHRQVAGRAAFFAGGGVLLLGIIVQTFAHALDPWLVWALLAMIIAKVGARYYSTRYH